MTQLYDRKRIIDPSDPWDINHHNYSIDSSSSSSIWSSSLYHNHHHHNYWSNDHLYVYQKCTNFISCQFNSNRRSRTKFSNRSLPLSMFSSSSCRWPLFICISLLMIINTNSQSSIKSDHWRSSTRSMSKQFISPLSSSSHHHLQHYIHHPNLNYTSSSSAINRQQQQEQRRSNRMIKPQIHQNHHQTHQSNNAIKGNSPYYNSQLLSIPFPSQQQILYQHPNFQNYFHYPAASSAAAATANIVQRSSSSSPSSQSLRRSSIVSNQIPRSINPMMIETNMIPSMKVGSKWW